MLAVMAFALTDETYAVAINRFQRAECSPHKHWYYIGSAFLMYTNWQLCTWIGVRAGQMVGDPAAWGLEFAFVATFIGILAPTLRSRPVVACVVASGASALLLVQLPHQLGLVFAASIGVLIGLAASRFDASRAPEAGNGG
jgi:predicted branched-subunit amino acid permease